MAPSTRIPSIDLLRGLDVLLMLVVNEMAGVKGTPAFLLHYPSSADGMTLTDVVFPAFLFLTGMSIPLALGARLARGESRAAVWRHVLVRTASLLVIGVLMINAERASPDGPLPGPAWNLAMTAAVALVWMAPAEGTRRRWRVAGIVLLVVLALLYRGQGVSGLVQLRPYWWGILGLIGWAYLAAAAVYLLAGDRPAVLVGATAILYCLCLADEVNGIGWLRAVRPVVHVGRALGSHGALAVSGAILTLMLLRHRRDEVPDRTSGTGLGYAAALAAAGLLLHALHDLHSAFWINKVRATVAWCLLSAAFTVVAWVAVHQLADVRAWRRWPPAVTLAGENALAAYLMAPFLLSAFALLSRLVGTNPYEALSAPLWVGTIRSVLFAWVVVRLCGWMSARGLRLTL
jgi:hypothetical protein